MLIPLRFTIKTEREEHYVHHGDDVFVDLLPIVRIEIEAYDTAVAKPVIRGFQLLRATETVPESMGTMTERVLSPGALAVDHVEYLQSLRAEIDRLIGP